MVASHIGRGLTCHNGPTVNAMRLGTVLAHPDDETFGVGGTLIRAARRGARVHTLCLTRGELGYDSSDPSLSAEKVGAMRADEICEAGRRMGAASVTVLDWGDGGMEGDRGLPRADARAVESAIAAWLSEHRLDVLITWGPDGGYGHPDHIAAGERCLSALDRVGDAAPRRVYRYVAYEAEMDAWTRFFPEWDLARRVKAWKKKDLGLLIRLSDEELESKWRAMEAHRSQASDLANWQKVMRAAPDSIRFEAYVRHAPRDGGLETDLA